jgi:hypothetical protein
MSFAPVEKEVIVPLLSIESSKTLMHEPGVTSITFYRGDLAKVSAYIRARFKEIVDANPWLAGRLVRNKDHKNVQLVHPQAPISDDVNDRLFHPNPSQLRIGSEMRYEELSRAAKSAVVKKGSKLINKPAPVTRITIVPDVNCPEEGFALIFSISHIAADGQTYYQILNSLSTAGTIQPLQATRIQKASEKVAHAVGKKEYGFLFSVPMICNVLKGMVFSKKAACFAFYVDPDKVKKAKAEVTANPTEGVDFISTNDILTSSFARTIRARLCMMAINFRNRIDGIVDKDAGNYEAALLYDEEKYERPSSIRKTLQEGPPFLTTAKPLPGFWEGLLCTLGQITNWATFAGDLVFEGCEQQLHLPMYNTGMIPFDCAIVFRPMPGKLAVMYFAKTVGREELLSSCELGEPVSTKMFQ